MIESFWFDLKAVAFSVSTSFIAWRNSLLLKEIKPAIFKLLPITAPIQYDTESKSFLKLTFDFWANKTDGMNSKVNKITFMFLMNKVVV